MSAPTEPTRARHRVVLFAVALAVITYVDRVCISQAAPYLRETLNLTPAQMGLAFSAFAWAYALFEIPGGWLGDRIGPRRVLLRVVVLWSFFTALTGYVWNFASLLLARFFFGMGEAGCFPNLTKAFTMWLPSAERTRAQSILWLSARWGGAFTPVLVIWVMSWLSWRNTFVLFGLIGLVWAFFFSRWFRDKPSEHPGVNAAELALLHPHTAGPTDPRGFEKGAGTASSPSERSKAIRYGDEPAPPHFGRVVESDPTEPPRVPWGRILSSPTVWLLWGQYFCLTYGWFFYITWLPTYLKEARGLALDQNAFMIWLERQGFWESELTRQMLVAVLAGIPLFFGGLGSGLCALLTQRLVRATGSVKRTRRTLALVGFGGAGALLVWSFYIEHPLLAMLAMGLASLCNDLTMPGSWSTCMDVGGGYAGTLSGSMNMMGSLGAALAPLAIGVILDYNPQGWALTFWISGIVYLLGGLCWLGIDPVTPLEAAPRRQTGPEAP